MPVDSEFLQHLPLLQLKSVADHIANLQISDDNKVMDPMNHIHIEDMKYIDLDNSLEKVCSASIRHS